MMSGTSPSSGIAIEHILTDREGWHIYHLVDYRAYTIHMDTVRVGKYDNTGDYRVEVLRTNGWTHLFSGDTDEHHGREAVEWATEGVQGAVAIIYRMPDALPDRLADS